MKVISDEPILITNNKVSIIYSSSKDNKVIKHIPLKTTHLTLKSNNKTIETIKIYREPIYSIEKIHKYLDDNKLDMAYIMLSVISKTETNDKTMPVYYANYWSAWIRYLLSTNKIKLAEEYLKRGYEYNAIPHSSLQLCELLIKNKNYIS